MKKMLGLTAVLVVLYFSLQIILTTFYNKYENEYVVVDGENSYTISETLTLGDSNWEDNYFINISIDNIDYTYEIYNNYHRATRIVTEVKYYSDETFKCLFLKFKGNKILSEVRCYNGEYIIPYHNIVNKNEEIKNFVDKLKESGYDEDYYNRNKNVVDSEDFISVYDNEIVSDYFIGVYANKKLYRINKIDKIATESIDYPGDIQKFLEDKFVTVDMDANYIQLHIYSVLNNSKRDLVTHLKTSDYKFIGAYNNKMYFYNKDDKTEYEIDVDNQKIVHTKTNNYDIKYFNNGEWTYEDIENIDLVNINFGSKYALVSETENEIVIKLAKETLCYYYFKKNGNSYNVYRANNDSNKDLMFLFATDDYNSIKFMNGVLYYIDDDELKMFSDEYGDRSLLKYSNSEEKIAYNIYAK